MPRRPTTPQEAQARAKAHALKALHAAEATLAIIAGEDTLPDDVRRATLHDASRAMEAAGCYVRRTHDDNLLIP